MAGGSGRVRTGGGVTSRQARVENERLWVDAVISGGGGGGGGDVNIVAVGGNPVTTTVPVSGTVSVVEPVTVDGTVVVSSITNPVTIAEPVTVDGTVVVSSITNPVTLVEPVSVDDNGGSLTVDGTVAVSGIAGTVTIAGTVAVGPTVVPGTGATNLGKAEDSPHTSADVGVMALGVRSDVLSSPAQNGDYVPFLTDSLGKVWVSVGSTADSIGKAEDAAALNGDVGVPAYAVRSDTPAATAANGDYVPLLTDSLGRLHIGPGTLASSLGKAEDQAAASGDVGVMALAVRADTPAATAANGDYVPLLTDDLGRLHISPGTLASSLGKAEDAPHTTGDVGVQALAVRQDTLAALAGNGDYIPLTTDSLGRLNVRALLVENAFPLSSSTGGQPIAVTAATPTFVTLHTVPAGSVDTVTIYVSNTTTSDNIFIVGLGGTAAGQQLNAFIPSTETVVVLAEAVMEAGQVVSGSLVTAGTTRVFGKVIRRAA